MIYFFGTRWSLAKVLSTETRCECCGQNDALFFVYQTYFHVYWIPIVPLRKVAAIECQHCKKVTKERDFSFIDKSYSVTHKGSSSAPLYMYTGLIGLSSLVAYSVVKNLAGGL